MKSLSKEIIRKSLLILVTIYIIQLLVAYFLSGEFIFRRTELLLLSSLACTVSYFCLQSRKYFIFLFLLIIMFLSVFYLKTGILKNPIRDYELVKYTAFSVGVANLFILLSTLINKNKFAYLLRFIILFVLITPIIILWGYYFSASAWLNVDAVLAIMQTNFNEAKEYLHDYLPVYYYVILLLIITLLVAFSFYLKKLNFVNCYENKTLYFFVVLAILSSAFSIYKNRVNILTQVGLDPQIYLQRYEDFNKQIEKRKQNINQILQVDTNSNSGVYVLVIGESQNKNYMSAYGYERKTTPWLDSIKNNDNIVFFENAHSCHTHTVPVLTYALTAKNQYNDIELPKAVSLLEVVEAAGFDTVWISNQVKYGLWDTPTTVIANEANQQKWMNDSFGEDTATKYFDGKLLECLDSIKYSDKMLIVIHLMGNHGSYAERYPQEFNKFSGKSIVDEYDNSILYNDFVMQNLYEKLKNLPNFKCMVYFADHADAVKQKLGHDASKYIPEMTDIPFYICLADNYIKKNKDKVDNLQRAEDKYFTNDLIFNTVLSLMNIKIDDLYEMENDITSAEYDANPDRFRTLYGKKRIGEK